MFTMTKASTTSHPRRRHGDGMTVIAAAMHANRPPLGPTSTDAASFAAHAQSGAR
jgi:hypothetical protein